MGSLDELFRSIIMPQQAQPDFSEGDSYRDFAGLSDSLGQTIIQNRDNFGTKESIAGALITGLLGGGFNRASKDYQAGQQRDYTKAILDSYTGRHPIEQGDLSDSLFDVAKSKANVLDLMRNAEEQSAIAQFKRERAGKLADTVLGSDDPEQTMENISILDRMMNPKKAEPLVKQDPYLRGEDGEAIGSAAPLVQGATRSTNPNSRRYKLDQDLFKEEDAARLEISKLPAVVKLNATSTALSQLKNIKDLNTASSDIPFATLFVGGLDGSVVREGEYARVAGANPFLEKYKNLLEGVLNGSSTLGVGIKQQMYDELIMTQRGLLDEAKRQSAGRLATAMGRGGREANVLPFDPKMAFETPMSLVADVPGASVSQAGRIIADIKAQYGNTPEAKEMARKALEALSTPTRGGVPLG